MFNSQVFANSRADGVAVLEVTPSPKTGHSRRFVPLRRTDLLGEICGPLAALTVTHTYRYTAAACPDVIEARYRFPLPGDAAVTGVTVTFGDVEIQATLQGRAEAEREYTAAREAGRQAALLTRETPDVFTLQVAGIRPDEDVVVETTYVQVARAEGVGWSLRIPLTTAPRYLRGDERDTPRAAGQPLGVLRDPGHTFRIDVLLPDAVGIASPTHQLRLSDEDGRTRVRLAEGEVIPDRDFVLTWRPAQLPAQPTLYAITFDDPATDATYFLALVAPPAVAPAAPVAREIVLLEDHSGSMEGAKWEAADWAVTRFLRDLDRRDRFAVGLFHNRTSWFRTALASVEEPEAVNQAVQFVTTRKDSGGTELGVALEQALRLPTVPGEAARHVLVVTDAQVGDFGRITRLVEDAANRPDRRRVSLLCIDAAPNSFLVQTLAERGGGVARFLTSDPQETDIATALDDVLATWAQPIHVGLRLGLDRAGALAAERAVLPAPAGESAIDLGDLPAGRSLWVAGRVPRGPAPLHLTLQDGAGVTLAAATATDPRAPLPQLKALVGAWRVLGLEFLIESNRAPAEVTAWLARLGYAPAEAGLADPAVYAENVWAENAQRLGDLLRREALAYGLVSSATAFVATRQEAGKVVTATVDVPSALPAGWSGGVALAAMAAAAPLSFSVGQAFGVRTRGARLGKVSAASPSHVVAESARHQLTHFNLVSEKGLLPDAEVVLGAMADTWAGHPVPPVRGFAFVGQPVFVNGTCVLADTGRPADADCFGDDIRRLELRFPAGAPASIPPDLALFVFVGDPTEPVARVRVADLVRQGGVRPLNVVRPAGAVVRIVLVDPTGAWSPQAPAIALHVR